TRRSSDLMTKRTVSPILYQVLVEMLKSSSSRGKFLESLLHAQKGDLRFSRGTFPRHLPASRAINGLKFFTESALKVKKPALEYASLKSGYLNFISYLKRCSTSGFTRAKKY